jgi:hypothetical protein
VYQLSESQIDQINSILDACDEHPHFVNGDDVSTIAGILLEAFGPNEKRKQATKKVTPKSNSNSEGIK